MGLQTMQSAEGVLLRNTGGTIFDQRSLSPVFNKLAKSIYVPSYRNPINFGTREAYFDIQTGESFITQWKNWRNGDTNEHRLAALKLIEKTRKIFGFQSLQVIPSADGKTLEVTIEDQSYMLPDLGSGIAQFFMVLANVAIKSPSFVLIDEPELNLHPTLQREFLQCIGSFATEGVLFATHNLGLALSQADHTYSVLRVAHGHSEVQSYDQTPRLSEFLGEMSFAGYRQVGFDKILLVEGVTDVKIMQHFLSLYEKQDKIVVLSLGGNDLINGNRRDELQEILKICPNISVIIDSEKATESSQIETPRMAFAEMCKSLTPSIRCCVLKRRSTESYFSGAAITKILGANAPEFGHFDKAPSTIKGRGWKIAREMMKEDIDTTDLGVFLSSI
jgi:hypothetical protein